MTHPLVRDAQRLTADIGQHQQVARAAETVEGALASALGCSDPDLARERLPAALRTLYGTIQPLIGAGLVNGTVWLTAQHARLYAHAQVLFGAEAERVVQRPPHEPMPPTGRPVGSFLPRP